MKIEKTSLEGVLLLKPEAFDKKTKNGELFKDNRGLFLETYNKVKFQDNNINVEFIEDDISVSEKNVLRGIHGDGNRWKLISCIHGEVFFVVVNCDEDSESFGKWESFNLSDSNLWHVLIPPIHGNGYLALTDKIIFQYKQSSRYNPEGQFRYKWNDPRFNIKWPIEDPILSDQDKV
jgi:dTDP-4-dehydrorhamnose 3,5-epimerase